MEFLKNYRDNLSKKIKEVRSLGEDEKEAAEIILKGEQSTETYQKAKELHHEIRDLEKVPDAIDRVINDLQKNIASLQKTKKVEQERLGKAKLYYTGGLEAVEAERINYLSVDLKSLWDLSEEMSPILKSPIDLDWNELIKKSQEQSMTPGEFTLNPETLHLDFEKITPVVINKPEWLGKKRGEVMAEVIRDYSATHYIPGYDYIEWLNKNPDKHHDIFDKNHYFFAPATVIGNDRGSGSVLSAFWYGPRWGCRGDDVDSGCTDDDCVLLLPR